MSALPRRDGDKIEVRALLTLYATRGDYQLHVEAIRRVVAGNLYEALLRLKEKWNAEGLFDPARKRALPPFARCICIVTSPQAAALRDILTALARRAPHVRVILYPTPVQGDGAAEKIARASTPRRPAPMPVISGVGHETDISPLPTLRLTCAPPPRPQQPNWQRCRAPIGWRLWKHMRTT